MIKFNIQVLVDNTDSWYIPYAKKIVNELKRKHNVRLIHKHEDVEKGDVLFLISCNKKFNNLYLNNCNIVIHESDLPKGKGWSPLTWQVLEGQSEIFVTLFEASEEIDAGKIYYKNKIVLMGHELLSEIRHKQGIITNQLIRRFIKDYPNVEGVEQQGEETYYARRSQKDSELDINKSLNEQFDLLRVCDNKKFPAFFIINGIKYFLKITKDKK